MFHFRPLHDNQATRRCPPPTARQRRSLAGIIGNRIVLAFFGVITIGWLLLVVRGSIIVAANQRSWVRTDPISVLRSGWRCKEGDILHRPWREATAITIMMMIKMNPPCRYRCRHPSFAAFATTLPRLRLNARAASAPLGSCFLLRAKLSHSTPSFPDRKHLSFSQPSALKTQQWATRGDGGTHATIGSNISTQAAPLTSDNIIINNNNSVKRDRGRPKSNLESSSRSMVSLSPMAIAQQEHEEEVFPPLPDCLTPTSTKSHRPEDSSRLAATETARAAPSISINNSNNSKRGQGRPKSNHEPYKASSSPVGITHEEHDKEAFAHVSDQMLIRTAKLHQPMDILSTVTAATTTTSITTSLSETAAYSLAALQQPPNGNAVDAGMGLSPSTTDFEPAATNTITTIADPALTATDPVASTSILIADSNGNDPTLLEAYLTEQGIASRPKPAGDGTWNVWNPLQWAADFGQRSPERDATLREMAQLHPDDPGYHSVDHIHVPGVTQVRTVHDARIVVERLMRIPPDHSPRQFHACDTEVMQIDLSQTGPVGHGYVTCLSIYSGPDFDYGLGDGPGTVLWIDNLDDAYNVLAEFKAWLEDDRYYKVWHNYGFDRHVLWNERIDVRGFGGDTMHMARLMDTSRERANGKNGSGGSGYSLEALTADYLKKRKTPMKEKFGVRRLRKDGSEGLLMDIPPVETLQRDPAYRSDWIDYSATDAKRTWELHQYLVERLQLQSWYSNDPVKMRGMNLYDYYWMHMRPFGEVLTDMERRGIRVDAHEYLAGVEEQARKDRDHHCEKFQQWAVQQIGPDGWALNAASSVQLCTFLFGGAMNVKTKEPTENVRVFPMLRSELSPQALEAFESREARKAQEESDDTRKEEGILGRLHEMKADELKALCKECGLKASGKKDELKARLQEYEDKKGKVESDTNSGSDGNSKQGSLLKLKVAELKELCKQYNLKLSGRKEELVNRLLEHMPDPQPAADEDGMDTWSDDDVRAALLSRGLPHSGTREESLDLLRRDLHFVGELVQQHHAEVEQFSALSKVMEEASKKNSVLAEFCQRSESNEPSKYVDVTIRSRGLEPMKYTAGGAPSVTADVIRKLAGDPFADPPRYGSAFERLGKEGCEALYSLAAIGSIDTMLANFVESLRELADDKSRVHCSLNLNTETGRLSSRKPNLQNQPALEKDKYKIRKAFQSSPGNNLIVADYGQLELRILASITNCRSMIDAFAAGGDFHSRTALDMFDHVREKVDTNECYLEWDYSKGEPDKPLLKDMFASERRKAKTLNFSIAYGKTAHGLSQDWGVTVEEAEKMLQAWYDARKEVKSWQDETKAIARKMGYTRTLMGRYRQLPDARSHNRHLIRAAERAAINTPIQGGAADIAMMAMVKINDSERLKKLGWILLLQVHDEMILEGPEETAEEAFNEVITCMERPWVFGLDETPVPLVVDGSYKHKTWYEAK